MTRPAVCMCSRWPIPITHPADTIWVETRCLKCGHLMRPRTTSPSTWKLALQIAKHLVGQGSKVGIRAKS